MLILSRKKDESLIIGDNIKIKIIEVDDTKVKIGIEAPSEIEIHRLEVYEKIQEENKSAIADRKNLLELAKVLKKSDEK